MTRSLTWELREAPDGSVQRRAAGTDAPWTATDLAPTLALPVKSAPRMLASLISFLADNRFEEHRTSLSLSAQLSVGVSLAKAFLMSDSLPVGGGWIRLVPEAGQHQFGSREFDSFVRGIPWLLFASADADGVPRGFLARAAQGEQWVFTLTTGSGVERTVRFPLHPRVLVAIPDPGGALSRTNGLEHEAHLRRVVFDRLYADQQEGADAYVKVVEDWQEFRRELIGHAPDVVYFYGHGRYNAAERKTELAFTLADNRSATEWVDTGALRETLAVCPPVQRPTLFYANCCHGDADAATGVGLAVGHFVDAVITSRTFAITVDAQLIGEELLLRILAEGLPPHLAILDFYSKDLSVLGDRDAGARWALPVLHTNYSAWVPLSPRQRLRIAAGRLPLYGSSIPERVGRADPLRTVEETVKAMFASKRNTLSAIFWRSEPKQGLIQFASRVRDHLREVFPADVFGHTIVELQSEARPGSAAPDAARIRAVREAVLLAFVGDDPHHRTRMEPAHGTRGGLDSKFLDALQRCFPIGTRHRMTLLVTHRSATTRDSAFLKQYLGFWQQSFARVAGGRSGRVILIFPVECGAGDHWPPLVSNPEAAEDPVLVDLTPEFGPLGQGEIQAHVDEFAEVYGCLFPGLSAEVVDEVLLSTDGGAFVDVVMALRSRMEFQD